MSLSYEELLRRIPAPGTGCHPYLLRVAHAGRKKHIPPNVIFQDIRAAIPLGKRKIPDSEIRQAVEKASSFSEYANSYSNSSVKRVNRSCPRRLCSDQEFLRELIRRGQGMTVESLMEVSPVSIVREGVEQALLLLNTLYRDEEILFMGTRYDKEVHSVEWYKERFLRKGVVDKPYIIPNPLSGLPVAMPSGKTSWRCDRSVSEFRFALVEFDNLSYDEQLALWSVVALPIVALIDSGGKSIHAWLRVRGVENFEQWDRLIKQELYERRLIPFGVDPACKNPSRLSRLPGHKREETGRYQRLLYLNPEPQSVSIVDSPKT